MKTTATICRSDNSVVVELGERATVRLIEQAVRARAPLTLMPKLDSSLTLPDGRLAGCTADVLIVSVSSLPESVVFLSACCDASFMLHGQEYLFCAEVLDVIEGTDDIRLEIERPDTLQTWQRRRFLRADVAPSATVQLSAPADHDRPQHEGSLLNVSREGLACRVDTAVADAWAVDDRIGVQFALEAHLTPFTLNAFIRSKTPGGTRGKVILGVQFEVAKETSDQQERLAGALRGCV